MDCTPTDSIKEQAATDAMQPDTTREVLVFSQDPELRAFMRKSFYAGKIPSTSVTSRQEMSACLRDGGFGLVVVAIDSSDSLEVLTEAHRDFPETPIVAVARIAGPELVRDIMRAGATDFLFGSFSTRKFLARLSAILEVSEATRSGPSGCAEDSVSADVRESARECLARSAGATSSAVAEATVTESTVRGATEPSTRVEDAASGRGDSPQYEMVCRNPSMKRVLDIVDTVGPTESTVLIQGESGTGKEVIAKRIHGKSKRSDGPFVEVNCGALPENLLESQLFGHERGSFTGAVHRQVGLFEVANRGTIFLDEVGETSLDMQVKLLRVLQFRSFRRVGGSQEVNVDVRVLAATNKELATEVENGNFRSDLFYRLNVICLDLPPLRERLEEIPDLVALFADRFSRERGLPRKTFGSEALEKLQKYRWTGNVRELENAVERLMLLSKASTIDIAEIDEFLGETTEMTFPSVFAPTLTLDEVKRIHIANVLRENSGNKMKTARILKINVKTLYNLIKNLDIKF